MYAMFSFYPPLSNANQFSDPSKTPLGVVQTSAKRAHTFITRSPVGRGPTFVRTICCPIFQFHDSLISAQFSVALISFGINFCQHTTLSQGDPRAPGRFSRENMSQDNSKPAKQENWPSSDPHPTARPPMRVCPRY